MVRPFDRQGRPFDRLRTSFDTKSSHVTGVVMRGITEYAISFVATTPVVISALIKKCVDAAKEGKDEIVV